MRFVKEYTPPEFQAKNLTPFMSPEFNSFDEKKNTKNECKWRNLHRWQKFYTANGSDGSEKISPLTRTCLTDLNEYVH